MELVQLNISFMHIPITCKHWDRCSKALFVRTQHCLKNSCTKTSTWPACEMRSLIPPAGSCLPLGLHFHFPSLSHPLALAAALQQPRQTPGCRGRGTAWLSPAEDKRQAGPGRSSGPRSCSAHRQGIHSRPLPAWLFSAHLKMHENCLVFDLVCLQCRCTVHILFLHCSLGFSALWSTARRTSSTK